MQLLLPQSARNALSSPQASQQKKHGPGRNRYRVCVCVRGRLRGCRNIEDEQGYFQASGPAKLHPPSPKPRAMSEPRPRVRGAWCKTPGQAAKRRCRRQSASASILRGPRGFIPFPGPMALANPPARFPARHPVPGRPRSPSSSRWMMLSMLSLSISAIAFPPPSLPQRHRRRSLPPARPGLNNASFPRAPSPEAVWGRWRRREPGTPPPSRPAPGFLLRSLQDPREEQNGRRRLSQARAAHGCAEECYGPGRSFFFLGPYGWIGERGRGQSAEGRG